MADRLKRSAHIVAYWRGGDLHLKSYATGVEVRVAGWLLEALDGVRRPLARTELAALDARFDDALIDELIEAGILQQEDAGLDEALDSWSRWSPEATLFHFATKDYPFRPRADLLIIGPEPPPAPLKEVAGERIDLPPFPRRGELPETLLARRSWRRFAREPLALDDLAVLMGLTWAVQFWVTGLVDARLAFKTSPSGGAKHSIEVYAAALRVDGLPPATYHYDPDGHGLVRVADAPSRDRLLEFLPTQPHFADAAALFFMTSVFARVQSKYGFPRAYRVVQLEAGHLAQTFCLLGTWRGLAPFCTAALGDSAIERHLGIDGVRESVLYVTGVGARPDGVGWAPFGDDRPEPPRIDPEHHRRTT